MGSREGYCRRYGTDGRSQNDKEAFASAMQALDDYKECCRTTNTFLPMLHPSVDFRYNTKLLRSPPLIYMNNMSAPPLNEAEPTSVGASFYVGQKPS